ncbi:unnamed protein product [Prunus armeniaca]|uniref:Endonuclease/exonuclease/phosphatase domain-containing protein n=1 Tax=Prunus armeniaca TaxID=36596 RepID=A0A6J5UQG3_PRUAR|nr:unnamed protein product [Prunus armeniaca]CAB4308740.1 unnamed protein product [Prunus armeniaca]
METKKTTRQIEDEVTVSLQSYSKGHIDVFIKWVEQIGFRFTGNEYSKAFLGAIAQMREFGEALDDYGLMVINYTGYKFTWTNRWQCEGNVKLWLDRVVANDEMLLAFPDMRTHHINSFVSNHLPTLLIFGVSNTGKRHHHFMFEEMWITIDGCQETITQAWGSEGGTVVDKIMQIRGVQDKLNAIHGRELTPHAAQYQRQLTNELDVLLEQEETLLRQRSRSVVKI